MPEENTEHKATGTHRGPEQTHDTAGVEDLPKLTYEEACKILDGEPG